MVIPVVYNVRSAKERWTSSVVAVIGIAGTVSVFVAMLALARGFQATLVSSGLPENAIVQRAGSTSEMGSFVTIDEVRIVEDDPRVARDGNTALVSPEVVVIANIPMRATGTDANVQVRGVTPRVLQVRDNVKIIEGRFIRSGVAEAVIGKGAHDAYAGLEVGETVALGAGNWEIVGMFDSDGSAFDSEVWADASVLNGNYDRDPNIYQSVTARLASVDDFDAFKTSLRDDPRTTVEAQREQEYYASQSQIVTTLITVLGSLIAFWMGLGAVIGAALTMYSAVAERSREIAVLRAVGFGEGAVVLSFVVESLLIAFVGGVVGCLAVLPVNGLTTGTMNWQTFSHLAFAFRITPGLLGAGMVFALFMGLLGGLPPAVRAARANVAHTLRAL